ncbi:TOBE domain-containing protein, partial [Vibrio parahaemolyticus]|nr:TOBE domain-containing protein [Vibrio parahaemolyticus]
MKVSARNQLVGKVIDIIEGAVNSEVILSLAHGEKLATIITKESRDSLKIKKDGEAIAIIKAPWVVLALPDCGLNFSARNQFLGKVTQIAQGAVNSTVHLETAKGLELTAVITNESL